MTDTHLLKYYIHKNGDTIDTLAKYLRIKRTTLSAKINNRSDFRQSEIYRICARYHLSPELLIRVFMDGDEL